MKEKKGTAGGVGFVGLLQVAFIVMKLCGVIKWSWLWVVSPTWITLSLGVLDLVAYVILVLIYE